MKEQIDALGLKGPIVQASSGGPPVGSERSETALQRHYRLLRPCTALRFGTLALAVGAACNLSLHAVGVKKRSRTSPAWFSTWPFSQTDAGVQATGSTR